MIVYEFKVRGKSIQYRAIDEAIQTAQFVRNKCLRYWMDNRDVNRAQLYRYNTQLRAEYPFVEALNSHATQASVERCWSSIARFYDNCKQGIRPCGYPKFKKHCRSVEYKTSGWKLLGPKRIEFTDKKNIGRLKLVGTWDLKFYREDQIKRVRLVRRADGYYAQFCIQADVRVESAPTQQSVGIDLGLKYFLAYSTGKTEPNPQFYRVAEHQLNRANHKKSKKFRKGVKPQSRNYHKARVRYAHKHLRVSRQRAEYCKGLAYSVIQSNDLIAYEDLNVKGLVRNRRLAKSISDAGWTTFRRWLEYFGRKYGKATVAVPPHYTSQDCSGCGNRVVKSLSTRTHVCRCGCELERDHNAAINILQKGLSTVGHTGYQAWGDGAATLVGVNLLGQVLSVSQESHAL